MPRSNRHPRRKNPLPPVGLVHFRDPAGNERSLCNAEENSQFTGEAVVATINPREVTCSACHKKLGAPPFMEVIGKPPPFGALQPNPGALIGKLADALEAVLLAMRSPRLSRAAAEAQAKAALRAAGRKP